MDGCMERSITCDECMPWKGSNTEGQMIVTRRGAGNLPAHVGHNSSNEKIAGQTDAWLDRNMHRAKFQKLGHHKNGRST
eukprot:scaffold167206_cov20-Prasinocladus_malaysianus.AAC.1